MFGHGLEHRCPLAEIHADRIDWHQIARLVLHGCPPRLPCPALPCPALPIVGLSRQQAPRFVMNKNL
jgi:hypothetical protein